MRLSFLRYWRNLAIHQQVWVLTLPMILSNISVPLVGIVDTAVMGRLPEVHSMAAVGLGAGLYTFLVGCLNFLRMGTTGLTAQASGSNDGVKIRQVLLQGALLAFGLALIVALIAYPFSETFLALMDSRESVGESVVQSQPFITEARHFFHWRLWGLPAALLNFTLIGWFLGVQNARVPLLIMLVTNIINIALSIWFVLYLHKGVIGAAQAAIIAEWAGALTGVLSVRAVLLKNRGGWNLQPLTRWQEWKPLLFINRDIFIRSLALQIAFLLVTIQGARLGEETVAANMIILNGLLLISYLLDGFAHAIESLCGYAIGARDKRQLASVLVVAGGWGLIISLLFALFFLLKGRFFIDLLTSIESVRITAYSLLPFLLLLPLISVWSYLFDGLFIGATRAKSMRNSMVLALMIAIVVGSLLHSWGNRGLWIAFLTFMGSRGIILSWMAWQIEKRGEWITVRKC